MVTRLSEILKEATTLQEAFEILSEEKIMLEIYNFNNEDDTSFSIILPQEDYAIIKLKFGRHPNKYLLGLHPYASDRMYYQV